MTYPIKLFVGTSPDGQDAEAQMVLERSVRARTRAQVEIEWMRLSPDPKSFWYSDPKLKAGWQTERWATPFSGFRFGICERCKWQGRAIYVDVDQLVVADIQELWEMPIPEGKIARVRQMGNRWKFCVILWDCARARPYMTGVGWRSNVLAGGNLCAAFPADANWNCIDGEGLPLHHPSVKLHHFSDIAMQPHIPMARNRLAAKGLTHWFDGKTVPHIRPDLVDLWMAEYNAARREGYREADYDQDPPFGSVAKRPLQNYVGGARRPLMAR